MSEPTLLDVWLTQLLRQRCWDKRCKCHDKPLPVPPGTDENGETT